MFKPIERGVVFLHIPKTAGTSLTEYLISALGKGLDPTTMERGGARLFFGHHYLSDIYHQMDQRYFITYIRHPISRTISQYRSLRNPGNYSVNWRSEWDEEQVAALEFCREASFSDFLFSRNPIVMGHIVNVQTRMLADFRTSAEDLLVSEALQRDTLRSALENLSKKINFLGIFDMMPDSLRLLREELGGIGGLEYRNVSEKYEVSFGPRERSRLQELLALDLQLYNHGLQLFQKRLALHDDQDTHKRHSALLQPSAER